MTNTTLTTKYRRGTLTYKAATQTTTISGAFRVFERDGNLQVGRHHGTLSPGSTVWICTVDDVLNFNEDAN